MVSMNIVSAYSISNIKQKAIILSEIGRQITMHVREYYSDDGCSDAGMFKIRCANEVMHKIFGQQVKLIANDHKRYPDENFLNMIMEMSAGFNFDISGMEYKSIDSLNFIGD